MKKLLNLLQNMLKPLINNSNSNCNNNEKQNYVPIWGYTGEIAPEFWGKLSPEFCLCDSGMKQSPINIENPIKTKNFDIGIFYHPFPLNVVNNGRTLMFNCERGCYITINNTRYDLLQFHFHSPAEHLVQNELHDFELHLVHQDSNDNIAVIGVLFAEGRENDELSVLWEHFPLKANDVFLSKNTRINPANLLPKSKIHYFYEGSLTTPPCTENVIWFIYTEVLELSVSQRDKFINVIGKNSRPVKPINGRKVYLSG